LEVICDEDDGSQNARNCKNKPSWVHEADLELARERGTPPNCRPPSEGALQRIPENWLPVPLEIPRLRKLSHGAIAEDLAEQQRIPGEGVIPLKRKKETVPVAPRAANHDRPKPIKPTEKALAALLRNLASPSPVARLKRFNEVAPVWRR